MRFANLAITRPILARAAQVVFISETTKKFFARVRFSRPPETIFNGVNTDLYRTLNACESKVDLRQKYNLPADRPAVLFVGRFVEKKGISVMKRMVSLRPDYIWAFAGWGPLDPGTWNAPNARVFYGLRGESIAALYRACDLFVLPSTGEGLPLVLQEALASGLPVVCSTDTLTADPKMKDSARGVTVHAGDDERTAREFLSAIDDLLNTDSEIENKSAQRRAFAVTRYSWPQAVKRYLEIVSRLTFQQSLQPIPRGTSEKAQP
jgi:glycosyltransferase involved in cell wall biosynthesis